MYYTLVILTKAFILYNCEITDFYPFGIADCQIFWKLTGLTGRKKKV